MMPGLVRHPLGTVERQEIAAEGVERGQEGREHAGPIQHLEQRRVVRPLVSGRQDGVLAPKAGERKDAGQGQAAEQKRPVRDRHQPPQAAEAPHVDTPPMACITLPAPRNNRALKKACVNRWNMPAAMPGQRADAQAQEHVAQLADRRIGQHAFQIGLRQRRSCRPSGP